MNSSSSKIIGPFLGPRGETGIEIFIALPEHQIIELTCKVFKNEDEINSCNSQVDENDPYKLFNFKFENLEDNCNYNYKFFSDGKALNLENGLREEDCKFRVLGSNDERKSFVLISCHNPFVKEKGSADEGWSVWEQLSNHLENDSDVRLLVLGGDQVYNDEVEKEFLAKLKKDGKAIRDRLIQRFIKQYQKFWGNLYYRKILASTLSVAMWDDHDITDGWGSRPDSFKSRKSKDFKDNWVRYFETASEVFGKYQASRNPKAIQKFSSILDWGNKRFVLADFRSERNSNKNQIWTKVHKNAVLKHLHNLPENISQVFFLSPVVAFRTNFKGDTRVKGISEALFRYRKWFRKSKFWKYIIMIFCLLLLTPYMHKLNIFFEIILQIIGFIALILVFIPRIKHLPDLSDDMEDGLSSGSNMSSLKEILEVLLKLAKQGKKIYILSGDIHVGGLSEVIDMRENTKANILQIVSSPIAYKPMPKVVAGFTTTTSEMQPYEDQKELFARNIFYSSKRNFVQIFPDKEKGNVVFHFEGHQCPFVFSNKFTDF